PILKLLRDSKSSQARPHIQLGLAHEKGFPHTGELDFTDNQVDPGTGTLRMRGVFKNSGRDLTPGMFVRVRVPLGRPHAALLLARFFIDRPVFAWVISIVIVIIGSIALVALPIAQYPNITPPTIQVACAYPGANATVVAETVAAPIEQQINGVENMLYMSSQSNNDGSYNLTITFKLGVNLDTAQVLVQNRVAQAVPVLPDVVKATGVVVKKQSPSILLV